MTKNDGVEAIKGAEGATAQADQIGMQSAIAQAQEAAKKTSKKKGAIIAVVTIVIALVAAVCVWLFAFGGASFFSTQEITAGQAPYKTEEEMQAESERTIEEGTFNISIASDIEFENAAAEGTAYIENVPNNPYDIQVTITDTESGDVVYESPVIAPNNYVEKIRLSKELSAGEHDATATFAALDKETGEQKGTASAVITLNVLS